MLDQLPPEIFARVLEIAIETWGIGFLPPIRLVNSTCNNIVSSTPSLWGIIALQKHLWKVLEQQVAKAKQSDIRLSCPKKASFSRDKRFLRIFDSLVALSHNWVLAELPTDLLTKTTASSVRRLQVLHLRGSGQPSLASRFFDGKLPLLHTLTLSNLTVDDWIAGLLSPTITHLTFDHYRLDTMVPMHRYLSCLPNLYTIEFEDSGFPGVLAAGSSVSLPHLHNLQINNVYNAAPLLLTICSPNIRVLSMKDCSAAQMSLVFSDWSQPKHLPSQLQTLELSNVLTHSDLPYLISFLSRIPSLLRLLITYYEPESIYDGERALSNVLRALAHPNTNGDWLCSALIHLCLDVPLQLIDAIPIARARGNGEKALPTPVARLRSVQVPLCAGGTPEEASEFRSFFLNPVEDVRCMCLSCSFNVAVE
ncbi:hypothetical protein MIND_01297300 [Mycena indigotica]|uniref:F-box domain-containing protein n=1 Tax=Mycena indigotica TaxID=2126181 RepID=A0A8H6S184_9AGAR|nr:uncharacterized protein MIND_01297300 [Mycena indigotica]KAF7290572.1 hypothetical protein MIND_01297300 [Mycena indigotica]